MIAANPRILLLSHRQLRPTVCRTSQNEYEDLIASLDAAEIVSPRPYGAVFPPAVRNLGFRVTHRIGWDLQRRIEPERLNHRGEFDLLFVVVQHPSDLNILNAIPGWRGRCKKAVVFIEELWIVDIKYEKMLRPLEEFDAVICGHDLTVAPLQEAIGVPCYFDGVGVDAIKFCPFPKSPQRVIDFLSVGRRGEETHAALLAMADQQDFYYEYDTMRPRAVIDGPSHRQLLANRIKRARYFLANKPKVDSKHHRGEQEEVGMRYYEGAAGGAVMIGEAPKVGRFKEHFGWEDSCVHLPYNSTKVAQLLADLDQQPERLARIRRDNVVNSLLKHDWAYRFEAVLKLAGLFTSSRLTDRIEKLQRLASAVQSAPAEEATTPRPHGAQERASTLFRGESVNQPF